MGSETTGSVGDRVNRKNPGKVSRKIHKAEREKLKRDNMNELFFNLEKSIGLDHPNNGKASILRDTVRLLGELFTQVDNLKKENAALLAESNYVTTEKNELLEETSALDAEIKKLQREIDERGNPSNLDIAQGTHEASAQLPENNVALPLVGHVPESTSILGPVFVMPLHHESEGFPGTYTEVNSNSPKVLSSVSRPRPRYPSSSDIWPAHILTKQMNVNEDAEKVI